MHERLQGHLDDPWTRRRQQGQSRQLLPVARRVHPGHRAATSRRWPSPGRPATGQARPLSWATSAAATTSSARSPGPSTCTSRRWPSPGRPATGQGEAIHLGNLGNCYSDLGQTARGHRAVRAGAGHRPGDRQPAGRGPLPGQPRRSATATSARPPGPSTCTSRRWPSPARSATATAKPWHLANLGEAHGDLGSWDQGAGYCRQAIEIADAIGSAQVQSWARRILARIQLLAGDLAAARQAISAARDHDYPPDRADVVAAVRDRLAQAGPAGGGRRGVPATPSPRPGSSWSRPAATTQALDTKALALCGLALTTEPGKAAEAATAFRGRPGDHQRRRHHQACPRAVRRPSRRRPRRHPRPDPPGHRRPEHQVTIGGSVHGRGGPSPMAARAVAHWRHEPAVSAHNCRRSVRVSFPVVLGGLPPGSVPASRRLATDNQAIQP